MKLVITVISNSDVEKVMNEIGKNGYSATKISTTGQFLVEGHTAILIVCDDEKAERLYEVLKSSVSKRFVRTPGVTSTIHGSLLNQSVDVEEGGGIAFTVNVEEFQKF